MVFLDNKGVAIVAFLTGGIERFLIVEVPQPVNSRLRPKILETMRAFFKGKPPSHWIMRNAL